MIGTLSTHKIGFFGTTQVVQATTAVSSAARNAGSGASIKTDDTFDGYTVGQVVKVLRNYGLLQ